MKFDFKAYNSMIDYVIQKDDEERTIKNPTTDQTRLNKYLEACRLAFELFPQGKGKVTVDNPQMPYSYHCIHIDMYDDDFEGKRLHDFARLLDMFDGLSFFGKDTTVIVLQMVDLYY